MRSVCERKRDKAEAWGKPITQEREGVECWMVILGAHPGGQERLLLEKNSGTDYPGGCRLVMEAEKVTEGMMSSGWKDVEEWGMLSAIPYLGAATMKKEDERRGRGARDMQEGVTHMRSKSGERVTEGSPC
jgi:hypothetical protein